VLIGDYVCDYQCKGRQKRLCFPSHYLAVFLFGKICLLYLNSLIQLTISYWQLAL